MLWAAPEYGWLVLLLIPLFFIARRAKHERQRNLHLLGFCDDRHKAPYRWIPTCCRVAAFLLVIIAICRPQWGGETEQQEVKGIDIIIALDVSRSMLADDISPTRLSAAKKGISALSGRLQGDRIGLIAFAGSAFLVCPLTSDYAAFRQVLNETDNSTIPLGGSDLSGIVKEVRNGFVGTETRSRLLILVSDGEDHGGAAAAAAGQLRESGITICSVTAGSDKGALIPLAGGDFLKDRKGAIVRSSADPGILQLFSPVNVRLDASGTMIGRLFDDVRPSLRQNATTRKHHRQRERFQIPMSAALLVLAIDAFFRNRRQT